MVEPFTIATLPLKMGGALGLCRLPGRNGDLASDVESIRKWQAAIVVSLTETSEMEKLGAKDLALELAENNIRWKHFSIIDYGVPSKKIAAGWPKISHEIKQALAAGQNVLLHCRGGVGRSGMIALRLMIELGEAPDAALERLRAVRPGAIETTAQMNWARAESDLIESARPL